MKSTSWPQSTFLGPRRCLANRIEATGEKGRVLADDQEFLYVYLQYHPSPTLGQWGDRMTIALVAFPPAPNRANLWIQKGRLDAIPKFGHIEDKDWIEEFIREFEQGLATCASPKIVIEQLEAALHEGAEVLRFSALRSVSAVSLDGVPSKLGFEVEANLSRTLI